MIQKIKAIPGLHDIIEITYAYEIVSPVSWYNTTLFSKFLGLGKNFDIQESKKVFEKKIDEVQRVLAVDDGSFFDDLLGPINQGYLKYVHQVLSVVSIGFDFEIQKYYPDYEIPDAQSKTKQIEDIEQQLFGKQLIDNDFETSRSVRMLEKRFENGKSCGSYESCLLIRETLDQLKQLQEYKDHISNKSSPILIENKSLYQSILIDRNTYIEIFQLLFNIYQIDKGIYVDSRSSIYDAPEGIYFPNHSAYDMLPLDKLLSLLAHEIEGHYLVQKNSKMIFGASHVRGKNNLFREEGLARFLEDCLWFQNILDKEVTLGLPNMLLGEVYLGNDYLELTKIYTALKGNSDVNSAIKLFLRKKRNYSRYLPGVQHKDVTYSRGKQMVKEYLEKGGDFKPLFYAKVDFEDMQLINNSIDQQTKDSLTYPKFIAQRLLTRLEGSDKTIKSTMQRKLPMVDRSGYDFSLTQRQEEIMSTILATIRGFEKK